MAQSTLANLSMAISTAKAPRHGPMVEGMKANGKLVKDQAMESKPLLMVQSFLAIGLIANSTANAL